MHASSITTLFVSFQPVYAEMIALVAYAQEFLGSILPQTEGLLARVQSVKDADIIAQTGAAGLLLTVAL